jgi:hypothetical protein
VIYDRAGFGDRRSGDAGSGLKSASCRNFERAGAVWSLAGWKPAKQQAGTPALRPFVRNYSGPAALTFQGEHLSKCSVEWRGYEQLVVHITNIGAAL